MSAASQVRSYPLDLAPAQANLGDHQASRFSASSHAISFRGITI